MATTVIVYPSGTTSNSNPHILFSGGTGSTYTIEMTDDGELKFCTQVDRDEIFVQDSNIAGKITTIEYKSQDTNLYYLQDTGDTYTLKYLDDALATGTTNLYSGMSIYRTDSVFNSTGDIMYLTGDLPDEGSLGTPEVIRRVNVNTEQVTHQYQVVTDGHIHSRPIQFTYNSTDYLVFSEINGNSISDSCLTFLNPSNLNLIGREFYNNYAENSSVTYISGINYDPVNEKIYWTRHTPGEVQTKFGEYDMATSAFTTANTVNYRFNHHNQLLDGTQKVYSAGYGPTSSTYITGSTYGYFDFSSDTYTELTGQTYPTTPADRVSTGTWNDRAHSDINTETNNIYQVFLFDLIEVNGSNGNIIETNFLGSSDGDSNSAKPFVSAMGVHEDREEIWTARYNGSNTNAKFVVYGI